MPRVKDWMIRVLGLEQNRLHIASEVWNRPFALEVQARWAGGLLGWYQILASSIAWQPFRACATLSLELVDTWLYGKRGEVATGKRGRFDADNAVVG